MFSFSLSLIRRHYYDPPMKSRDTPRYFKGWLPVIYWCSGVMHCDRLCVAILCRSGTIRLCCMRRKQFQICHRLEQVARNEHHLTNIFLEKHQQSNETISALVCQHVYLLNATSDKRHCIGIHGTGHVWNAPLSTKSINPQRIYLMELLCMFKYSRDRSSS